MISAASSATNGTLGAMLSYLKLPKSGNRSYSDGSMLDQEGWTIYWSSTPRNDTDIYSLTIDNSIFTSPRYNGLGAPVRCLKN